MKPITKTLVATAAFTCAFISAAQAQDLSDAEKRALLENILLADTNNDGMLFLSEFEALIKLNADDGLGKAAKIERAGISEILFKKLDGNGDGGLTKEEAQALAEERG